MPGILFQEVTKQQSNKKRRTEIHDMIPADRAVVDHDIFVKGVASILPPKAVFTKRLTPCPKRYRVPLQGSMHAPLSKKFRLTAVASHGPGPVQRLGVSNANLFHFEPFLAFFSIVSFFP